MGIYKLNADELAEAIIYAINNLEGDFEISELEKAFQIVRFEIINGDEFNENI